MGWNGNTCYFTNAYDETFSPIEPIPITELVGGTDLENAPEGVCSDCHAGENPFIVHYGDPAFDTVLGVYPDMWPTPIVPATFPGNPDPLQHLGAIDINESRCDDCHGLGLFGGRLPRISTNYPEFCDSVLGPAVGLAPPLPATMPPGDHPPADAHIEWLTSACEVGPNTGVVVPFNAPTTMTILPPEVDPPYQCSRHVRVSNAVYGATLELYLNNAASPTATGTFRDPEAGFVFSLTTSLTAATSISVSQTVSGVTSARTTVATQSPPAVLPSPVISPAPLYACARSLAVINLPGAELSIEKTPSGRPTTTHTLRSGASHTWVSGLGTQAFTTGTTFRVRQRVCSGSWSDYSEEVMAEDAPESLPALALEPPPIVGQKILYFEGIVQGAGVTLKEVNSNIIAYSNVSVPYNAWRKDVTATLGSAITATHDFAPIQSLCGVNSEDPDLPPPQPCTVDTIVPRVAPAFAGDDFVLVTDSVPGSIVRVFDGVPSEIGNGSGHTINLTRSLVAGEVLMVTARLDGPPVCAANRAFSIVVQ